MGTSESQNHGREPWAEPVMHNSGDGIHHQMDMNHKKPPAGANRHGGKKGPRYGDFIRILDVCKRWAH